MFDSHLIHFQNGKCDIGFGYLYMKPERKKYIDYITPHSYDSVCFFIAKPLPDAKWLDLLKPFNKETWICFIIVFILGKLTKFVHRLHVQDGRFSRMFIGLAIFMTRILIISYRSSLNAVLTVHFTPKPVDSLQELADIVRCYLGFSSINQTFGFSITGYSCWKLWYII